MISNSPGMELLVNSHKKEKISIFVYLYTSNTKLNILLFENLKKGRSKNNSAD